VEICPPINGLRDLDCNGTLSIAVLGDSLVAGTGDSAPGGYLRRAERRFRDIEFYNGGLPGQRTTLLYSRLKTAFSNQGEEELRDALLGADVVVLDLGRNDRWYFGEPEATYRNLKRITSLIKRETKRATGLSPLVIKAVLMLPNRGSQGPWVKELNEIILRGHTPQDPADLRFDLVSKRLLSFDQIHPSPQGYDALAKTFNSYIKGELRLKLEKLSKDSDGDHLSDRVEIGAFNTDPLRSDTDGDGKGDGEELFVLMTDPLVMD